MVGRSRNCSEPFARLRDPGVSSHSVAQLLCGLDDRLSLCRESYVLARISSKYRCAKRERKHDARTSDRPDAQATWSAYCFHGLILMRPRISRKLIRHFGSAIIGRVERAYPVACFVLDSISAAAYVQTNMKTLLLHLWARISRKLTGKPQQMELKLWTRRSSR
jgi:hypothetical protein